MNGADELVWVQQVIEALQDCLARSGAPRGDVDWLVLRCRDTLSMNGEPQEASLRQLRVDVRDFFREFQGQLPSELSD
jgi:hypothetical protein